MVPFLTKDLTVKRAVLVFCIQKNRCRTCRFSCLLMNRHVALLVLKGRCNVIQSQWILYAFVFRIFIAVSVAWWKSLPVYLIKHIITNIIRHMSADVMPSRLPYLQVIQVWMGLLEGRDLRESQE